MRPYCMSRNFFFFWERERVKESERDRERKWEQFLKIFIISTTINLVQMRHLCINFVLVFKMWTIPYFGLSYIKTTDISHLPPKKIRIKLQPQVGCFIYHPPNKGENGLHPSPPLLLQDLSYGTHYYKKKIEFEKIQHSGAFCNRSPPAIPYHLHNPKLLPKAQNGRRGLETGLTLDLLALMSTFAK